MYSKLAIVMVLAGLLGIPATADVIYDNGGPNGLNTWFSDAAFPIIQLDDFVLEPGANVVRDIHWYGAYDGLPPVEDAFAILILDSALENIIFQLLTLDAMRATTSFIGQDGLEIFEYWLNIDPLELDAEATYWLGILSLTSESQSIWGWSAAGDGEHLQVLGDTLSFQDQNLAFRLTNDVVPEPATMGLLGLGLVGMVVRFRKRLSS